MRIQAESGLIIKCLGRPLFIIPTWDGVIFDGQTGRVGDPVAAAELVKQIERAYPGNITREIGAIDIII